MSREPHLPDSEPDDWASLFTPRAGNAPACPAPALVQAARAGALPPDAQEAVSAHIAACFVCTTLAESLDVLPLRPTADESDRILRRIHGESARARPRLRSLAGWWWLAGAAAASLLLVAFWRGGSWTATADKAADGQTGTIQSSSILDVGRPPLLRPMTAGEVGSASTELEAGELAAALVPYREGDFARAAERLSAFVARYPQNAEGQFYLGLTDLVSSSAVSAVAALETAERLGAGRADLLQEVQWYLAIAYLRAGHNARAWDRLFSLCRMGHGRAFTACAALRELAPSMRLEGVVADPAGRPIAGAVVAEHTGHVMPQYLVTSPTHFTATTGADGRYLLAGAPRSVHASIFVRASAPGFFTASAQVPFAEDAVADFTLVPWRLIALGQTVSGSTADDPECLTGEPCQLFAVTVDAAGTFEVSVTSAVRKGMDVYVEAPSGDVFGPRLEAPLALELPAVAGATFQIRVMSFDGPREFQLTTRLR